MVVRADEPRRNVRVSAGALVLKKYHNKRPVLIYFYDLRMHSVWPNPSLGSAKT